MNDLIAKCAEDVEMEPPNHLHILLAQSFQEKSTAKTSTSLKK